MKTALLGSLVALVLSAVGATGCTKKTEASAASSSAAPAHDEAPGPDGSYALTTAVVSPDCKVGSTCTVTLRLEALGDYHLNAEYPYKFTGGNVASVEYLGTDGAGKNVFTKAAGDFAKQSEKVGVMTVKLKPSQPGNVTIEGVYKLSVCSEATCKLDNPSAKVTLAVK